MTDMGWKSWEAATTAAAERQKWKVMSSALRSTR